MQVFAAEQSSRGRARRRSVVVVFAGLLAILSTVLLGASGAAMAEEASIRIANFTFDPPS
jgi:hypothetical protein